MADTKSNLEKFNTLVNPENKAVYYKSKDKKGPNANRVAGSTISDCYEQLSDEFFNIKMASHSIGIVDIDIDDQKEKDMLVADLENRGLKYVLVATEKGGHYHIIMKRPPDMKTAILVNGTKRSWISHDYKMVGPNFLMYWGPILPTSYNNREFVIIPDTLDTMPEDWIEEE